MGYCSVWSAGTLVGDEDYDSDEAAQIRHFNSQATSIILASLCREEYNKVQGLKNAKEIWDVLKTAHEGGKVSHPVLEGKPNANHVRARISYSRTQQLHNMDIITQCSK
jgi:hypothetical protein